jgi:hypothetical protein
LYNLLDPDNPIELAFQTHYGSIVTYKWFGDGYILLGFTAGYFIAISTHIKEVGQELFQVRNHKNALTDITICEKIGKAASCGDNKYYQQTRKYKKSNQFFPQRQDSRSEQSPRDVERADFVAGGRLGEDKLERRRAIVFRLHQRRISQRVRVPGAIADVSLRAQNRHLVQSDRDQSLQLLFG